MSKPKKISKEKRLNALFGISIGLLLVLFFRLGQIMFFQAEELETLATEQWTREITISADRGDIVDCTGEVLAQSATAKSVLIYPNDIDDAREVSSLLAEILGMDEEGIYEKAINKKRSEVWIRRHITEEQEEKIRELGLTERGVGFFSDVKRYYPYGAFASQILGYTNIDGDGQEGIEKQYEKYLAGYDGTALALVDAHQNTITGSEQVYVPAQDGYNVNLTIDAAIQSFAENAAREAYEINQASKIVAIVMDPKDSDVLAMVNYPEADLNDLPRSDIQLLNELSRNSAVVDAYEPGSTFKTITTAAALNSGAASLDSTFHCQGHKLVDGEKIKCWRSGNPHGTQTLTEAVENSCNPAFMEMALEMGTEQFYEYIYNFGFGTKTGINYSADGAGIVRDSKYVNNCDLARIGFGQSVAVTPLQLINGFSAIINGGTLHQPRLVSCLTDDDGNVVEEFPTETVRQVISEETSEQMRGILESVVANGSGSNGQIEGYRVGGKTGTAQMYEDGKIVQGQVISSFITCAPADDPEFAVLFIVYEPKVAVTFGSVTAAPFAKDILEQCLKYRGILPESSEDVETKMVAVPDVVGMTVEEAKNAFAKAGLQSDIQGGDGAITAQSPAAGTSVKKGSTAAAVISIGEETECVPDLSGMTVMEAYKELNELGLELKLKEERRGESVIDGQYPSAGSSFNTGDSVTVTLKEAPTEDPSDEE